jgi:hypothetical protein
MGMAADGTPHSPLTLTVGSAAEPRPWNVRIAMTSKLRPFAALLMVLGILLGVTACGETWEGLKDDTEENLEDAEDAVD